MKTSVPTTRPPGKGWNPWLCPYQTSGTTPYDFVEVEVWRKGWFETRLYDPGHSPFMNVAGLMWRPASPELTDAKKAEVAHSFTIFRIL